MHALLNFALITLAVDCVLFASTLDMPKPRLFVRLALITVLSLLVALVGSLIQFLYGDWLFINSWGTRDLFLVTTAIKLPFAFVALPRMEFPKFFSLVTLGNFIGTVLFTVLIWQMPWVIGLGPGTMRELEEDAIGNGHQIRAAIEKFRINHDGEVPAYLYGGDAVSWKGMPYSDRLLQEGLLEQYPRNPLHLHRAYMPGRQVWTLPGLFLGTKTPEFTKVRDAWLPVVRAKSEPRFGLQGVRMGNILADPVISMSALPIDAFNEERSLPLPGGFIYRASDTDQNGKPDSYILAVYGAETTAGLSSLILSPPSTSEDRWREDGMSIEAIFAPLAPLLPGQDYRIIWITFGGPMSTKYPRTSFNYYQP